MNLPDLPRRYAYALFCGLVLLLAWLGRPPFAEAVYEAWLAVFVQFPWLAGLGRGPIVWLLVSALGWVAVAIVVYEVGARGGKNRKRPFPSLIAPLFILLNPILATTWGLLTPWLIALTWLTILFPFPLVIDKLIGCKRTRSCHSERSLRSEESFLQQSLKDSSEDLGMTNQSRSFIYPFNLLTSYWEGLGEGSAKSIQLTPKWLLSLLIPSAYLFLPTGLPSIPIFTTFSRLLQQNELLWLFLPLILLGLVAFYQHPQRNRHAFPVVWTVAVVFLGRGVAVTATAVLLLYLAALGVGLLANQLVPHHLFAFVLALPCLFALTFTQWQQLLARPTELQSVEAQVAQYIQHHTFPAQATLLAPAHVGYTSNWASDHFYSSYLDRLEPPALLKRLIALEPDYIVDNGCSLTWQTLTSSNWFQERYLPSVYFPNITAPELILWKRIDSPFDHTADDASFDLQVNNIFKLRRYRVDKTEFQPGDGLYITLDLEATQPVTKTVTTNLHLVAAQDERIWAWKQHNIPHVVPGGWWQSAEFIPERMIVETTSDLPEGAYELRVFWHGASDETRWPIVEGGDSENVRDWSRLGYLLIPPANVALEQATSIDAIFSNGIQLTHTAVLQPDDTTLLVDLFWQADGQPAANYTVFVHLLNEAGELVANHDGVPDNGRYPTASWHPNITFSDPHQLILPADLPSGTYQLYAGLYLPETGERLAIRTAAGDEMPNAAFPLQSIVLP